MTTTDKLDAIVHRARKFWKIASGFPPNKEEVYPEHARAQEFDRWGDRVGQSGIPSPRDRAQSHEPTTVLEYGCGGGSDTLSYLTRGCRVVAVDINPANVATTALRVREHDRGIEFHDKYAVWLLAQSDRIQPFDDTKRAPLAEGEAPLTPEVVSSVTGPFDVASSHGVLHHIPQPLVSRVVAEIYRLLKPGGWFYAMLYTPALMNEHRPTMDRLMKQQGLSEEEAFGWCTDGEGCPWAEAYTHNDARHLFEPAGFQIESHFDYHDDFFRTYCMRKPVG